MLEKEGQIAANARTIEHLRQLLILFSGEDHLLEPHRLQAPDDQLDWESLIQVVACERVGPLLYYSTKGQQIVPVPLRQSLKNTYLATAKRNLFLYHELQNVLHLLNEADIPVIILKGAALAESLYQNIALRPMRDLDLLVFPSDAARTVALLESAGYLRGVEPQPGAALAYENQVALYKSGLEPYLLEIHWSLFDSPYYQQMPMDWFWESAQEVDTPSGQLRILGSEAQIMHLCGHITLHHAQEPNLLWMHDLALFIHTHMVVLDWGLLLEKTQEFHLVLSVRSTLDHLSTQWQVPIPAAVLETLQAMDVSPQELQAFTVQSAVLRPVAQRFWSDLSQMHPWRERLHYAWISLFPSPTYMRERYQTEHSTPLPLLYLYRLWLGLRSGATAVRIKTQHRKQR
jgi:hypothetical protein